MAHADLVLHVGARRVERAELDQGPCPPPEGRWRPVAHGTVLAYAERALVDAGYRVENLQLGLSRDDARFFGTLTLGSPVAGVANLAIGVRSSTDKSLSLQWCCGSRVFVCDNLAFSSEKVIARKHTTHGVDRYQEAICKAVGELADYREYETSRIQQMQSTMLTDEQAESILLRAFEKGILSHRTIATAIREWRTPTFSDFLDRSAWSLFNAITLALGKRAEISPQSHAAATIRLGALVLPHQPRVHPCPN
jgi:hypothetical protein